MDKTYPKDWCTVKSALQGNVVTEMHHNRRAGCHRHAKRRIKMLVIILSSRHTYIV